MDIINIVWYIFLFFVSFIFATFLISSIISLMFGDYRNVIKNTLFAFRPQKDIISENIERNNILDSIKNKINI